MNYFDETVFWNFHRIDYRNLKKDRKIKFSLSYLSIDSDLSEYFVQLLL